AARSSYEEGHQQYAADNGEPYLCPVSLASGDFRSGLARQDEEFVRYMDVDLTVRSERAQPGHVLPIRQLGQHGVHIHSQRAVVTALQSRVDVEPFDGKIAFRVRRRFEDLNAVLGEP